ncbi:MAG: hypothetical protein JXJ19_05865 [Elusimicrobia bacterium]|nr:hypothetical protein [Elusimicrobiota bacterium]
MKTLKVITISILVISAAAALHADWVSETENRLEDELEPLAADIGAAISGGLYREAQSIGFPGIDAGIKLTTAKISDDNPVKDDISGDYLAAPWLSIRAGLPKNIAVFARGFNMALSDSDDAVQLMGLGAKYSLVEEKTMPFIPNVALLAAYNSLEVGIISVNTITAGCVISKKLPMVTPYAGISWEMIRGKFDTLLEEAEPSKDLMRIGAGLDITLFPAVYLNIEADSINSNVGVSIGLGLKFST